ncbi:MAG: molybdenum cofactor biosynthesis protein MoaE [Proteobacteria bacterium]|nr:molybdenum cofactor biosynthesis protein MoaE [Pseudomonadota bacterium]
MELFEITEDVLDVNAIVAKVSVPQAGAISTFIGVTRNYTEDKKVDYLVYEAYYSMSLELMNQIASEAKRQFDIEKVAISHRIGKVAIEEASVVIAVSAGHRKAAINACHFAIDRLKEIVPIWKKEFMLNGEQEWIANKESSAN